jgi:hypothetical protein
MGLFGAKVNWSVQVLYPIALNYQNLKGSFSKNLPF